MNRNQLQGHLAATFSILVWGVTFVSTKLLLLDFSPLEILFLRFFLGWLALWAMCPAWLKVGDVKREALFAAAGLSGVTIYFLFENVALTMSFASNVGVIVSVAPFFTALLAWKFLRDEKPGPLFPAGFLLAMTGIFLVTSNGARFQLNPLGDGLALMAALSWAVYSILTKKLAALGYGSLLATRRIFFYGLLFMMPFLAFDGLSVSLAELAKPINIGNLLFLGIGASALCFATWTFALKRLGAVRASVYIYLAPVITVITASATLHEPLTPMSATGIVLTIAGLVVSEARLPLRRRRA